MIKIIFITSTIWIFCFLNVKTFAQEIDAEMHFYINHAEGWHWYQDPVNLQINKKPENGLPNHDPIIVMKELHQALNRSLDRALLTPTIENVQNYMLLQQWVSSRATLFAKLWQVVLLNHPDLDYAITHPTSSLGRTIYLNESEKSQDKTIHEFAKNQGLFFFYRGDCPYCQRFAPILKGFGSQYGIQVIAISTGGGILPEFPQSRIDAGQALKLQIQSFPALFAVNPKLKKIWPVGFGLMSEDELKERIVKVSEQFLNNLDEN